MPYLKEKKTNVIHVAAGIFYRDGFYLITQRFPDAHYGLYWEFPGGKRHEGESLQDCLIREIMEELGVEIEVGELISEESYQTADRLIHLYFFRCRIQRGELQKIDCYDFRWVMPNELRSYQFPPADEKILDYLSQS
ncbi:MAG: (deoxy)nucleoside triphosphate pyrophosphohydrolase [Chlamydiota bacterium]|nr:(deoxy)nucleoside triphosphate pyrophosphohydrolase [Chlamydiota bacterium]